MTYTALMSQVYAPVFPVSENQAYDTPTSQVMLRQTVFYNYQQFHTQFMA